MLNSQQHQQIAKYFPFLQNVDDLNLAVFDQIGTIVNLDKGEVVGRAGEQCNMLALVLSGVVRVYKQAESGRELTLYRINPGESCVLTASCVLSNSQFPAEAIAESNVMAVIIPASAIRQWITQSDSWRDFVFSLISLRLSEVIAVVDEVAFKRLDSRIAKLLLSFPINH
ncbi:MAG: Crp/Fnr family transcriptional regulator, partial [bacterium]